MFKQQYQINLTQVQKLILKLKLQQVINQFLLTKINTKQSSHQIMNLNSFYNYLNLKLIILLKVINSQ